MGSDVNRFTFFRSYYDSAMCLDDSERLAFYDSIVKYAFENDLPELQGTLKALFLSVKPNIDKSIARIKKGEEDGKKGGAPKGNNNASKNKTTPGLNADKASKDKEKERGIGNENGRSNVHEGYPGRASGENINCYEFYK